MQVIVAYNLQRSRINFNAMSNAIPCQRFIEEIGKIQHPIKYEFRARSLSGYL